MAVLSGSFIEFKFSLKRFLICVLFYGNRSQKICTQMHFWVCSLSNQPFFNLQTFERFRQTDVCWRCNLFNLFGAWPVVQLQIHHSFNSCSFLAIHHFLNALRKFLDRFKRSNRNASLFVFSLQDFMECLVVYSRIQMFYWYRNSHLTQHLYYLHRALFLKCKLQNVCLRYDWS